MATIDRFKPSYGLLRTRTASSYAMFDKRDDWMKRVIEKEGHPSPIIIEYNPVKKVAIVSKGDEQIAAAKDLRQGHVPVSVLVSCYDLVSYGKAPKKVVGAKVIAKDYKSCIRLQKRKPFLLPGELFPKEDL